MQMHMLGQAVAYYVAICRTQRILCEVRGTTRTDADQLVLTRSPGKAPPPGSI